MPRHVAAIGKLLGRCGWRPPASRNFRRLWAGQAASLLGTQVTLLALPLTAAVVLDASPVQMGVLFALETLPVVLFGLFVGVWVDRLRKRPLLIAADLGRAALMGSVPLAALLGSLSIAQLCAVAFGMGVLTVCFDTAAPALLPSLVGDADTAQAFGALGLNESAAEVAGPGLAGVLVQTVSAPLALVADAASYLVSACLMLSIDANPRSLPTSVSTPPSPQAADAHRGAHATAAPEARSVLRELADGLRLVFGDPTLRMIALCIGCAGLFVEIRNVLLVLFAVRELQLSALVLGMVLAIGSVGGVFGALASPWLIERFGARSTFLATAFLLPLTLLLTPLAIGSPLVAAAVLVLSQITFQITLMISNTSVRVLRQTLTPDALLGRVTASMRVLTWGALPVGALLGGALAERLDLRATLLISALGALCACLCLLPRPPLPWRTAAAPS